MPDARLLRDKAKSQSHPFEYVEYPGMFHNWMLSPIPEGRRAVKQIAEFIERLERRN